MTKKTIPSPAPDAPEGGQHAEVASIKSASSASVAALEAEIAELRKKLQVSDEARSDAEKAALAAAEAQGALMQREIQEVATGKTKKVRRANGYEVDHYTSDNREVLKPIWHDVQLATYFYKVDLPPVGGDGLNTNGIPLLHGVVYELDIDTLRSVKERVYRLWDHERNISGSNENFYHRPQTPTISARR
jgi:hypothetical protein